MSGMGDDRRKVNRRYLAFYSRVFDVKSHHLVGHVVDITPQGLMLISETPLPTDTVFRLEIELPEDFADKRAITFDARSRWCEPDIDPHFHNTGFELFDLAPEDAVIIENIVTTFGFRDNKKTSA
jgi:hypothetical protein